MLYSPDKKLGIQTKPIKSEWGWGESLIKRVSNLLNCKNFVIFAQSAAWKMKRWLKYWSDLISMFEKSFPEISIVLLGGPSDNFIQELNRAIK